jgi:hypothetical protein
MTTWDEWFTYLDELVDFNLNGQIPDVCAFFRGAQQCRRELALGMNDPRARILDELWAAALLLVYLDVQAADLHRQAAARQHRRWQDAECDAARFARRSRPDTRDRAASA